MEESGETVSPPRKRRKLEEPEAPEPEQSEIDHINRLPYEVLCNIFDLLYLEEQLDCALVCRRWHAILRAEPYIDRMRYNFSHCFGLTIQADHQQYMAECLHCVFHDCGSYPDTGAQANMLEMVRKAMRPDDEAGPSARTARGPTPEDLLFTGELPFKTLEIKASYDRIRRFLGDRLPTLHKLTELRLTVLPMGLEDIPAKEAPLWTLVHDTLRSLTWTLFDNTYAYVIKMPALERYKLDIANDYDLGSLMAHSRQLVELCVWFHFDRAMEQTLTCPFPRLRKLIMNRFHQGDRDSSPEPNTRVDDLSAERFVRGAPVLEDLVIISDKVAHRIFRAVCLFGAGTLTRLTVHDVIFPRAMFLLLLELRNLEFLSLNNCILDEGSRLRGVDLPRLKHLEFIHSGTCFRFDAGFANLRRLFYSMDSQLSRLCRNLLLLEDLEILMRTRSPIAEEIREHFQSLPTLANLHTLRLCGMRTYTRPWAFCKPMPNVRRLVLRKCYLLRCNFKLLPKLFPMLRVLELDGTTIAYRRLPEGVKPMVHLQRRLKQFLPGCCMVVKPSSRAEPVETVLLMQNKRKWREHLTETYGAKFEVREAPFKSK
uniref:F-box domain-containing protein n=1 Tax=Anopheles dirus TaxID=7168 RepID=A0A182NPJ1_9DIPT